MRNGGPFCADFARPWAPCFAASETAVDRPPCWPEGRACPNSCARSLYDRVVYNRSELHGPWAGWRLAGRDLVAPDGQRIAPERLRGLLFRQEGERRVAAARAGERRSAGGSEGFGRVVRLALERDRR
jgi:hypothetical protein